jgi:hypothetical protein
VVDGANTAALRLAAGVNLANGGADRPVNDLGADYFTRQNPDRLTRRLIRQLEALGHSVTLEPRQLAA